VRAQLVEEIDAGANQQGQESSQPKTKQKSRGLLDDTVLAITGDPPKLGNYPDATAVYDLDSIGLLRMAAGLTDKFGTFKIWFGY
jgi:hypothetical protein